MEEVVVAETTLGEDVRAAFDQIEVDGQEAAQRARDEKGRFVAGNSERDDKAGLPAPDGERQAGSATPPPVQSGAPAPTPDAAPATPEAEPRPSRPSSWKKEYWEHWDKLDPAVAAYIHQREQESHRGALTLKEQAERAKPVLDALAPFEQLLQQHNIHPTAWIQSLGTAHKTLALGSPQDKLAMFQKLAADYQIPAQLAVQGNDGQWQLLGQQPQPSQPQFTPADIQRLVAEQVQQQTTQQEIAAFAKTHPHYEAVRSTMAGLLQSNVAEDLESAYEKAVLLTPDIRQQVEADKAQADAAKKAEQARQTTQRARANAVSPRSATPSNVSPSKGERGLREEISENLDAISTGRV